MTWLLENPLPIAIVGLIVVAILAGGWLQTGSKGLLYAMFAAIGATALLLLLERLIVTDREQVRAAIRQIAADVENNDLQAVLSHIHGDAFELRREVENELPKHRFQEVDVKRNLQITVDSERKPPQAVAEFNVVVAGTFERGVFPDQRIPRFLIVTFYKEDGHWRVRNYEHYEAQRGYLERE